MTRSTLARRAALAGAVALVAASVAVALPASAHSYLVSSTPGDGEVLATLPAQFSVTANEPLLDLSGDASGFAIQVVDAAGAFYGDGCFVVSGSTLSMGASLGAPGDYRMYWQVISDDGHPVSGELAFSWTGTGEATGLASPPVCGQDAEPEPTPTAEPTTAPEPEPSATAAPVDENEGVPLDFTTIGLSVLALLGAVAVILLAVRALRGMGKSSDRDDDNWNAPPSS
ncbi:copper resistance CopC family protein [Salinibacterium soli]|uniref:Copper resistance protein CopC n=1 Tax=Antiquaquibacter soli TaxID=3064523 RepID=A0ABT9BMT6_9MICO|nr:copper resistance protein CopC [Protaetiibacter sp. WY-16]MDO7882318.1 copper resistance protein CopC [Protaetiibacter sp. WY-16]